MVVPNSDSTPRLDANAAAYARLRWMIFGLVLASVGLLAVAVREGRPLLYQACGFVLMGSLSLALFVPNWAGLRFTLWIFIANLAAMLQPSWFRSIGGFSLTNSWLLLILVQCIMFGMGTQMRVRDFYNVVKMPWPVMAGLGCQFLIMPLLGYLLAITFALPPEIGAGLILVGSCSSGLASNVMTYMARGNLALSVTLTSLSTLLAPVMTPLWMKLLAGSMVQVDAFKMSLDIIKLVLVPILAAFVGDLLVARNRYVRRALWSAVAVGFAWLVWLITGGWDWIASQVSQSQPVLLGLWSLPGFLAAALIVGLIYHGVQARYGAVRHWMPRMSMFCIVYFTLVATAEGRDQLLSVGYLLVIAVIIQNLAAFFLGYGAARVLGMNRTDARTIAIEVGLQNGAMAVGLARSMNALSTTGLAAVIFGPLMNFSGSILANYWRTRPVDDVC